MSGLREFVFKHALTRDVAYSSLPRAERRDLHRRVAEWIQHVAPDRDVETAELAAYHYGEAISFGEDDPALICRAFQVFLSTGESAMYRTAFVAARTQLEKAARVATSDDERATALLALAEVDTREAKWENALPRLDAAEQLTDGGSPRLHSATLALRSRVAWMTGRWRESLEAATGAVSALAGLPESTQLARALARLSQIEMLQNRDEAVDHALEAITVAERVGDDFANVNARINLFTALAARGGEPAEAELFEIVDAATRAGAHEEAYRAIVNFVWSASGFLPVARIEAVASTARAGRVAPAASLADYLELSLATLLYVPSGRWTDADQSLRRIDPSTLTATSDLLWRTLVGGQALRRGDMTAAASLAELRSLAMASGEAQRIVPMASVVLPWLYVSGQLEELGLLTDEILAGVDGQWPAVHSTVAMVRALAAAGEFDRLAAVEASLQLSGKDSDSGARAISLITAGGLTAMNSGRLDDAVERLSVAVAREDQLGCGYASACLKLDLATALQRAGRRTEADAKRREAKSLLTALGCVNSF